MTATVFLILLSAFSVISGFVTEGIKNIATDKINLSYNLMALITALIVGGCGTVIYYQLNAIPLSTNNMIYMILMGFASGLTSMIGFDKVKQAIEQLTHKK